MAGLETDTEFVMAGIDALWRVLGMWSIIFRVLAGLIGILLFWVFYVARNDPNPEFRIGHYSIPLLILTYAIVAKN